MTTCCTLVINLSSNRKKKLLISLCENKKNLCSASRPKLNERFIRFNDKTIKLHPLQHLKALDEVSEKDTYHQLFVSHRAHGFYNASISRLNVKF